MELIKVLFSVSALIRLSNKWTLNQFWACDCNSFHSKRFYVWGKPKNKTISLLIIGYTYSINPACPEWGEGKYCELGSQWQNVQKIDIRHIHNHEQRDHDVLPLLPEFKKRLLALTLIKKLWRFFDEKSTQILWMMVFFVLKERIFYYLW